MTQGIINGILLPEIDFDHYACWPEPLTRQLTMVTGRMTVEIIGTKYYIWRARWSFDYIEDDIWRPLSAVLRSGAPFIASVLPDNGDELVTSSFLVDSFTQPTFLIEDGGRAVWHGAAWSLREEYPHA